MPRMSAPNRHHSSRRKEDEMTEYRGHQKTRLARIVYDLAGEMDEAAKWLRSQTKKTPGGAIVAARLERLAREARAETRKTGPGQ